jgi:hypothetical protein
MRLSDKEVYAMSDKPASKKVFFENPLRIPYRVTAYKLTED